MSDTTSKPRREFRNVDFQLITTKYRLPFAGKVSILHRVSGALLFLSLPLLITIFTYSVASPITFAALGAGVGGVFLKLVLLVLLWGFMHHLCAGIRFLILDLHIGMDKVSAQKSAKAVLAVSLTLTVIFAIKLFGVL
ncbi:succinate dehydrogenase, cytochrome b556 subunit [Pelistega europaea]|uniref:Succinate dehydrogenase cytochrome b556 subunit n=1 Tax=Pelistega europaea TaxID=106147 RepID=A0A7Y4L9F5_9BURK|nr:succinate dehydrogenase, cytochrome b556 subunit [Pelistega europaea]NOL49415.1 succinate dehydrogenase, cytochrome b556 subunit [Pelistega europaea]